MYRGSVRKASSSLAAKQTILFTNDAEVIKRERMYIYSRAKEGQPVVFFNNGDREGSNQQTAKYNIVAVYSMQQK